MAQRRTRRFLRYLDDKSLWVGGLYTVVAAALAFAGPYDLPGPLKGLVPAAGVILIGVQGVYRSRRSKSQGRASAKARARARESILQQLKTRWLDQYFSTTPLGRLGYNLQEVRPRSGQVRTFAKAEPGLRSWTDITSAFEASAHQLLLVGPGGIGKTWTLLTLAEHLHRLAILDTEAQIPVILHFSEWSDREEDRGLAAWAASELQRSYGIPLRLTRRWLDDGELILLIDGLDEIRGKDATNCVRDINGFVQSLGLNGLVVTTRPGDTEDQTRGIRVDLTVELQPMSLDDVLRGGALPELADHLTSLDHEEWARELLTTPLMLSLARRALPTLSKGSVDLEGGESIRSQLFEAYIEEATSQPRGLGLANYSPGEFRHYLGALAAMLDTLHLSGLSYKDVTSAAVPGRLRRWVTLGVPLLTCAGVAAIAVLWVRPWLALLLGFSAAIVQIPDAPLPWVTSGLDNRDLAVAATAALLATAEAVAISKVLGFSALVVSTALLGFLCLSFSNELEATPAIMAAFGVLTGVVCVVILHFTGSAWLALVGMVSCAAAIGGTSLAVFAAVTEREKPRDEREAWWRAAIEGLGPGAAVFGIVTLMFSWTAGVVALLGHILGIPAVALVPAVFGIGAQCLFWLSEQTDHISYPRATMTIVASVAALLAIPLTGKPTTLPLIAILGPEIYVVFYLLRESDGVSIAKRLSTRLILRHRRRLPWRFERFGQSCVDRLLLRRVDGRYEFWHPLLREHLTELPPNVATK
jgi:hypothetical protein